MQRKRTSVRMHIQYMWNMLVITCVVDYRMAINSSIPRLHALSVIDAQNWTYLQIKKEWQNTKAAPKRNHRTARVVQQQSQQQLANSNISIQNDTNVAVLNAFMHIEINYNVSLTLKRKNVTIAFDFWSRQCLPVDHVYTRKERPSV